MSKPIRLLLVSHLSQIESSSFAHGQLSRLYRIRSARVSNLYLKSRGLITHVSDGNHGRVIAINAPWIAARAAAVLARISERNIVSQTCRTIRAIRRANQTAG